MAPAGHHENGLEVEGGDAADGRTPAAENVTLQKEVADVFTSLHSFHVCQGTASVSESSTPNNEDSIANVGGDAAVSDAVLDVGSKTEGEPGQLVGGFFNIDAMLSGNPAA